MDSKTISVIIPHYQETPEQVFPVLSSLQNQVGIDFSKIECILVTDGDGLPFDDAFLSLFTKLNIRAINLPENVGPGVARQVGIDNAVGEYVMFCDADDILHSVAVLGAFLQEIDAHHPDMISSPWLEELYDERTKQYIYVTHDDEITWMHGKLIRRLYLQTKNIRFHDELRVHEDSYFLAIANDMTQNKRKLMFTSYVWKYRPDSITRRNGAAYTYDSIPVFMNAIGLSFDELERKGSPAMQYKVVQFVMYNYFTLHQDHWLLPDNAARLEQAERVFAKMISRFIHYFLDAPSDLIRTVYNQERARLFGNSIETEHLRDWLNRIGSYSVTAADAVKAV